MENLQLATTCEPHSQPPSERPSKSGLIKEWIAKLALNAGQALDATAIGIYQALWEEGFEDLPYGVLEAAFRKTLRECKFWPVKVADVRERVDRTRETAVAAVADVEWQNLLAYIQEWIHPDIQEALSRRAPKLSERVDRAARAAGGLSYLQSCSRDNLQWAKKRFVELYLAWDTLEQDQFLLPDGELKNLLAGAAQAKALPSASVAWNELRRRGAEYAEQAKNSDVWTAPASPVRRGRLWESAEERERAYQSLNEKETDPTVLERVRQQKAALEARGFSTR